MLLLPFLPLFLLPIVHAAKTVLGLYIFSRHGDRTSKSHPPTTLTPLGHAQIYASGASFRQTYINGTTPIHALSPDLVNLAQISASAPLDSVLMPSAQGFLQGLYPPVGPTLGGQKLANGSTVRAPLGGYQLVPVQTVATGAGSEDQAWLQGAGNCANAEVSSDAYFASAEYGELLEGTRGFYGGLLPVVNGTFGESEASFANAYSIFDYLNVATIHNASIPSSSLLTPQTLLQLRTLADAHEFGLAYNASEPVRAIAGATLAAQVVAALNKTAVATTTAHSGAGSGAPLVTLQLGAYAQFLSFFGLAGLTAGGSDGNGNGTADDGAMWRGIPDYASAMAFELFTEAALSSASSGPPGEGDLKVRFLWRNGTVGGSEDESGGGLVPYPLFGQPDVELAWGDFAARMGRFAVGGQADWCRACGNSTGVCAAEGAAAAPGAASGGDNGVLGVEEGGPEQGGCGRDWGGGGAGGGVGG